ncbi:palmitoyltransferase ZDHHC17-like [Amia ocellicauda]|uniref:palmitoyltransferase ZDHHC17-like n=1 Tax=Amia ocellicauda TaxID=2972642 RepID=UPI003464BD70
MDSHRLQDCKTIIQSEGPAVLSHFDAQGCTPAHWAALAGSCQLLQHFVDEGGLVDLPCRGELGQRPVHWAAVGGHTGAVELLGRAGVALDVGDRRGYTPLMVAAQYGHMELCCFLLGRGDGLQCRDCEGDSALHWAAFRGECVPGPPSVTVQGSAADCGASAPQTPLHLAVLSGDLLTVRLLCEQDAVALNSRDRDGNTPLQLCHGRRRRQVAAYLENTIEQSRRRIPKCDWSALVFGPPGKSKGSILFLYGCLLLWGYPTYFLKPP